MEKDDYFVLAYRVLKYLYECLKAEETPLAETFGPGALGIGGGYWRYLMGHLSGGGYLSGVRAQRCCVCLGRVEITPKGIEYLLESPLMEKAAEALRPSGALGA